MTPTVFITGVSSGLGLALAEAFLAQGTRVFGLSRRQPKQLAGRPGFTFAPMDLSRLESIRPATEALLSGVARLDRVILNAGILGGIGDMADTPLETLNMLIKLYAAERPDTHFAALAPGLVETGMQAYVRTLPTDARFPTVARLKQAHGTQSMPSPETAAALVIRAMERLRDPKAGFKSGEFQDIRNLA